MGFGVFGGMTTAAATLSSASRLRSLTAEVLRPAARMVAVQCSRLDFGDRLFPSRATWQAGAVPPQFSPNHVCDYWCQFGVNLRRRCRFGRLHRLISYYLSVTKPIDTSWHGRGHRFDPGQVHQLTPSDLQTYGRSSKARLRPFGANWRQLCLCSLGSSVLLGLCRAHNPRLRAGYGTPLTQFFVNRVDGLAHGLRNLLHINLSRYSRLFVTQ